MALSVRVRDSEEYGLDALHSAMLIRLSALQMPLLTQTASGGKMMAMMPRKMSLPHIIA